MTNRQFRILILVLMHILISVGVNKKEYARFEETVREAMDQAERYNG